MGSAIMKLRGLLARQMSSRSSSRTGRVGAVTEWFRQRDAPEQPAEPGRLVAVNEESGSVNNRPQATIDVGEQRSRYDVQEPSRIRGLLLIRKEFVEYREASASLQYTGGFL